jgi:hypothetical protein
VLDCLLSIPTQFDRIAAGRIAYATERIRYPASDQGHTGYGLARLVESGLNRATSSLNTPPEPGDIVDRVVHREPQLGETEDQQDRQQIQQDRGDPAPHHFGIDPHRAKYPFGFGRNARVP